MNLLIYKTFIRIVGLANLFMAGYIYPKPMALVHLVIGIACLVVICIRRK